MTLEFISAAHIFLSCSGFMSYLIPTAGLYLMFNTYRNESMYSLPKCIYIPAFLMST